MGLFGGIGIGGLSGPAILADQLWHASWRAYRDAFVDGQGRVIDYSADEGFTTSEGQSYALFFSLVANDRSTFNKVLAWTKTNLAGNRLGDVLPSWKWGRNNNSWGVLGHDSASDADSWLAYTLLEAGRTWKDHNLRALGHRLAKRIIIDESVDIKGFGRVLIPGSSKFPRTPPVLVDPSYTPLFLAHGIASATGDPAWRSIASTQPKMIEAVSAHGFAPDWAWVPTLRKSPPPGTPQTGTSSFDSIRCYLWAGLTPASMTGAKQELAALGGMAAYLERNPIPPQTVQLNTGAASGAGSIGFSAALLPYLARLKKTKLVRRQLSRVVAGRQSTGLFGHPAEYYSENLILYGLGGLTDTIRFHESGVLIT